MRYLFLALVERYDPISTGIDGTEEVGSVSVAFGGGFGMACLCRVWIGYSLRENVGADEEGVCRCTTEHLTLSVKIRRGRW